MACTSNLSLSRQESCLRKIKFPDDRYAQRRRRDIFVETAIKKKFIISPFGRHILIISLLTELMNFCTMLYKDASPMDFAAGEFPSFAP